jgi:ribose/xylose/arabinose/galactoside ABC-type transport system permease subunit
MKLSKRIFLSLLFPVLMFLVMWAICAGNPACYVNGKFIYLGFDLVRFVILNACQSICVALAIWMQLKNGRFDFSNGAAMILTAIIAGNVGLKTGSPWITMLVAVLCGIILCAITAAVYMLGRLPIVIATIGVTLLYESLTYLIFGGGGISNFYQSNTLAIFGHLPGVLLPTALAMGIFLFYTNYTVTGRKGKILANNQAAGVNIGIWEEANVSQTGMFTGAIVGLAATIYVSQNNVVPQASLSTAGIMFSYIVPVYMGMFIGLASNDVIGISIAAVGMAIFNYGLNCMNLGGGGWQQIIMGVFVMCFYTFSAQLDNLKIVFRRLFRKEAAA